MTSYPTDMSNSQWQIISKYLDTQRSRKYELRQIMNAILYVVKTGCQWLEISGKGYQHFVAKGTTLYEA